jgi:metallo-beta-lactamase family protein
VLFVGYQAEDTLGRRILQEISPIRIFGEDIYPRATIRHIEGYSAHGDRNDLLSWSKDVHAAGRVKRTYLVHGELPAMQALQSGLQAQGAPDVLIPARGEIFEL